MTPILQISPGVKWTGIQPEMAIVLDVVPFRDSIVATLVTQFPTVMKQDSWSGKRKLARSKTERNRIDENNFAR